MAIDVLRTSLMRRTPLFSRALRYPTLCLSLVLLAAVGQVEAASGGLEVTATYWERITLPPGAELVISLNDVSSAEGLAKKISTQRYSIVGVPKTVVLGYDPQIIRGEGRYAIEAALWSSDGRLLFQSEARVGILAGDDSGSVEVLLRPFDEGDENSRGIGSIFGVQWIVTEVDGEPRSEVEPAVMVINADLSFSIFGGCNRFMGKLSLAEGELGFPETLAGTLMACPNEVEALERRLLEALHRSERYLRCGSGLVLVDVNGRATVHLKERPE